MTRESAYSETVAYDTGQCTICDREVAIDQSAPAESIESKAYVAILGEGNLSKDVGQEGNWEFELQFQLDDSDQRHPDVSGFLICEQCANTVHGHPEDAAYYHGDIPRELGGVGSPFSVKEMSQQKLLILAILFVLVLTFIILL